MGSGLKRNDIIRQVTNLVFSIAQFAVTLLPAAGIGTNIGDRGMSAMPHVQPIYWSFFIWFFIYAGCIAYGIYQSLPSQRENELLRRIGFYTASAFIGVTVYALVAQSGGSDWILIGVFVWIFVSLLNAIQRLAGIRSHLTKVETYVVYVPVSLLTGWVSLAILVNIASALTAAGFIHAGVVETAFSLIILMVAILCASGIIMLSKGNAWYTLPVLWGLSGVVIANLSQQPDPVIAVFAALTGVIIFMILVIVRMDYEGNICEN